MSDLENRLQAQLTAQALLIETLLDTMVSTGQLDPQALVWRLEQYLAAPKARFADPTAALAVSSEVEAWADMAYDRYSLATPG
ncbi:hypothetical protein [Leeia aquatica]|uniref:Uncharacterized protein n=1 Tax=Leeia aquatica TaxID=2725557 RepID=A0A847S7E0_9NEIS|nr:hypothetical protein [Leeia aquatica]NLR73556.1 hypothetical protein [Leeia aquatica]